MLSNITQALTAVGVILTAISSWANRKKLKDLDESVIAAAVAAGIAAEKAEKAAYNTDVIVAKADEVKAQTAELGSKLDGVRDAALAVKAEGIDRIKNVG